MATNTNSNDFPPLTDSCWLNAQCCLRRAQQDVDAVPVVQILSARRDLSSRGSGPEEFRRVVYAPIASTYDLDTDWPDADRLPPRGFRSRERHASVYCEVPVGTLVQRFRRDVYQGKRGRCTVSFVIVVADPADPTLGKLVDCPHRILRGRPSYEVTLPTGEKCFIERRT